jgi:hypothetical protein
MKKIIQILIFFAAWNTTHAVNQKDFTVYRDNSYAFSIHYPKSWAVVEATHTQTCFKAVSENGSGMEDISINVIQNPKRKGAPPSEHIGLISSNPQMLVDFMKKQIPSVRMVSHGKTKLSNQDAYYIIVDFTNEALSSEH